MNRMDLRNFTATTFKNITVGQVFYWELRGEFVQRTEDLRDDLGKTNAMDYNGNRLYFGDNVVVYLENK